MLGTVQFPGYNLREEKARVCIGIESANAANAAAFLLAWYFWFDILRPEWHREP